MSRWYAPGSNPSRLTPPSIHSSCAAKLPERRAAVMGAGMIEALKERVNGDAGLVRRGRYLTTSFLLEVGATSWLISIFEGKIVSVTKGPLVMPSSCFALRAAEEEWQKFWSARPPPGSNDLLALMR